MRSVVIINNAGTLGIGITSKVSGEYVERNYLVGVLSYSRILKYITTNNLKPSHEFGKETIMSGAVFELPAKSA